MFPSRALARGKEAFMMIGQRFTLWSVLADLFGKPLRAELERVRALAPRRLFVARYPLLEKPTPRR